jgi:UDP-N-acetylmuramyl pentapeptide phosphotransferase/UDP-N-acetylglucosamine-1-phosphate transferase
LHTSVFERRSSTAITIFDRSFEGTRLHPPARWHHIILCGALHHAVTDQGGAYETPRGRTFGTAEGASPQVPTIGGIILFAAIIFSYSLWFPNASLVSDDLPYYKTMYFAMGAAYKDFKFLLSAMVLLFFIGVKDDIIGFLSGEETGGPHGGGLHPGDDGRDPDHGHAWTIRSVCTAGVREHRLVLLCYVVLVNAFNLIDGVDGLAGGVGLIASMAYGTWLYLAGDIALSLLAFVLAGSLVAFLVFNWHPAGSSWAIAVRSSSEPSLPYWP